MVTVTLAELRHHRGRVVALLAAIAISVGFLVACLSFVSTQQRAITTGLVAETGRADIVAEYDGSAATATTVARLADVPGVAAVDPLYEEYLPYVGPSGVGDLQITSIPTTPDLRAGTVTSGRWPVGPDEITLTQATAGRVGVRVGETFTVTQPGRERPTTMTVTGIIGTTGSLFAGLSDTGQVAAAHFETQRDRYQPWQFLVLGDKSVDDATLAGRVASEIGSQGSARTQAAYAQDQLDSLTKDTDTFGNLLLGFGAIALLVSSTIIANTLSVLVTQRRRQIGLLRAAGATRRQVRNGVVLEAAVLGLVGSAAGLVLGIVVAGVAGVVVGTSASGLVVPWLRVVLAMIGGVVVTVLAGLLPARRASAIPPIEALREASTDDPAVRRSPLRVVLVAGLAAVGAGLTVVSLRVPDLAVLLAVAGAGLLAVAVIVGTPFYLPALLRGFGGLAGAVGPTGRLAAANARRNPGRAAATCVALMLAVGLVMTLQVGTASTKATATARIAESYPVDLTVGRFGGALSTQVRDGVRAVPGVTATVPVRVTAAALVSPKPTTGEDPVQLTVKSLGEGADKVVQAGLGALDDRTVLVSYDGAQGWGLTAGEQITVARKKARVVLTVRISRVPDSGTALVTSGTLGRLDAAAPVREVWARVPDASRSADVIAAVRRVAALQTATDVGGALPQSAELDTVLDVLATVATALLGVAVLIALIGVGNTLGLSVLERTRESALLRALGLQRRQLRGMLVVEAVLLALAATVVGVVVGIGFGWLGTSALSLQADLHQAQLVIPVGPTIAVVAVAVVAGALASVLPAHRAAQAAPTAALADV